MWSRFQEWLSGGVLAWGLSWGCCQDGSWRCNHHLKALGGRRSTSKMTYSHGCCQEVSVPHCLLARGLGSSPCECLQRLGECPHDMAAGSPQSKKARQKSQCLLGSNHTITSIKLYLLQSKSSPSPFKRCRIRKAPLFKKKFFIGV